MKARQLDLLTLKKYAKRKTARPLLPRGWHHLVLKSRIPVLRIHHRLVHEILRKSQLRFGIELKSLAVMENHIHFCIRIPTRIAFANFLRMFTGQLAIRVDRGKLWSERAWTRIVRGYRDLKNVIRYVDGNPVRAGIFDERDEIRIAQGVLAALMA